MRKRQEQWKLLRVTTHRICAGAVWVQRAGVWACTQSAPILNWMRFQSPEYVRNRLNRMNSTFEWLPMDNDRQPELKLNSA